MSNHLGELSSSDPEPPPARAAEFFTHFSNLDNSEQLASNKRDVQVQLGRHALLHLNSKESEADYSIDVSLSEAVSSSYRNLGTDNRHRLEDVVISAMATHAMNLGLSDTYQDYETHTQALMNHVPLLFEPLENAMLAGEWGGDDEKRLILRSSRLSVQNQQLVLLGGLAAFMTFMQQHNR